MEKESSGLLLIIAGQTASGKDTVIQHLLKLFPQFRMIISFTTRPMRPGEIEGGIHHFIDRAEFEKKIQKGEIFEYDEHYGALYGTSKEDITSILRGESIIWRIDPGKAAILREYFDQTFPQSISDQLKGRTLVIFLKAPNKKIQKQRMLKRGMSEKEIQSRLIEDEKYWKKYHQKYDVVLTNQEGKLKQTVALITQLIQGRLQSAELPLTTHLLPPEI